MPFFDMPLEQLRGYRPVVAEPEDFDDFWASTIAEARAVDAQPQWTPFATRLSAVEVIDVRFPGFGGEPIAAWLVLPRHQQGKLPVVVEFPGYGGARGVPTDHLAFPSAGFAYLYADVRGQSATGGETADPHGAPSAMPGHLTRGIRSPQDYFYRRVFADAVRAVDAVASHPRIDAGRVFVRGTSQGGGIALATAGLLGDAIVGAMVNVPFLQHFERAIGLVGSEPYAEVTRFLARHDAEAEVFRTLSYIDGVNHAKRATAPALYSVGLMDPVCPPSTVFASFNAYAGDAAIREYRWNEHEGGGGRHLAHELEFAATIAGL
jgi:cephalosporin-C deacetylase